MRVHFIELRERRMGIASQQVNGIMLPILAAWSRRLGWEAEVSFTDSSHVDYEKDCDVVGISTYTFLAPVSYQVAERFRERGKIVVIGGAHTKGCAEEAREHADAVFDRCDEQAWHRFLKAVEAKQITPTRGRGTFFPSSEMFEVPPYLEYKSFYGEDKIPMLISSVGCPHACDFCVDWNSKYFKRDVDDVIEDVSNVTAELFVFCDPNFGVNIVDTSELLRKMIPLKKQYVMETSIAFLIKDEFLALLRDSGCIGIEIGLESLSTKYQKNVVRGESIMDAAIQRLRKIKEYIPFVQANFVFGLDDDTEETFHSVVEFHRRSNADTVVPHIVTPFPGTPFWDRMRAQGRIFEQDWRFYNTQSLVMTLNGMSPPRFHDLYVEMLRKVNSPIAVLSKAFGHFREYKSMKWAFMLFVFLLQRARNTFFYEIPVHHEAKRRLASEGAYDLVLAKSRDRAAATSPSRGRVSEEDPRTVLDVGAPETSKSLR